VNGYLMLFLAVALTTALTLTVARLLASLHVHHAVASPPRPTARDPGSEHADMPAP
jgi:hypothetical protein